MKLCGSIRVNLVHFIQKNEVAFLKCRYKLARHKTGVTVNKTTLTFQLISANIVLICFMVSGQFSIWLIYIAISVLPDPDSPFRHTLKSISYLQAILLLAQVFENLVYSPYSDSHDMEKTF